MMAMTDKIVNETSLPEFPRGVPKTVFRARSQVVEFARSGAADLGVRKASVSGRGG